MSSVIVPVNVCLPGATANTAPSTTRIRALISQLTADSRQLSADIESPFDNHCFEILTGNHHCRVAASVELVDQVDQVFLQAALRLGRQARERLVHGTVPGSEHVNPVLRRTIAEHEVSTRRANGRCRRAE